MHSLFCTFFYLYLSSSLLFKKSVFGTVTSMLCWSLESKIDWSPLRSVEYLPEISTWCQYFIQICSFLLLVVRVEKYLPLQPCSTDKRVNPKELTGDQRGSPGLGCWKQWQEPVQMTELVSKIQRQKKEALKQYKVFGQNYIKNRK